MSGQAVTTINTEAFRTCLGRFVTGVAIVTTRTPGGENLGVTVNSFSSVSLVPPMVLFGLDRNAFSMNGFKAAGRFAVNVLAVHQRDLPRRFARRGVDKWMGVDWVPGREGCPLFPDALAHIECTTYAVYDGGDHVIFVGEVIDLFVNKAKSPLVFYGGRYGELAAN